MKHLCTAAIMSLMLAAPMIAADGSRSAVPAARLIALLEARGLDAFAAENPRTPGRFVAALYLPGSQLLVISAAYSAPAVLRERIAAGDYRDVYVDLSSAGDRTNRMFVEDLGAPGLRAMREEGKPFDLVWRDVTNGIHYDGDPAHKLSKPVYLSRFEADDAAYAELLVILEAALGATTTADGTPEPSAPQGAPF
jgi:hypothetical protein